MDNTVDKADEAVANWIEASKPTTSKPLELVKLRNGAIEARAAVGVIMQSLMMLAERKPVSLYEMVEKCRTPGHKIWGDCGRDLEALSLVSKSGGIHDTVRNVVLSAAEGEGMALLLQSPLAE